MPLVTKCCKKRVKKDWNGRKQVNHCSSCNKKVKLKDMIEL
jgi:hypothetical protein